MRKSQVLKPLAGMMEDEAQIVFSKFKEAGVNCRLLPSRVLNRGLSTFKYLLDSFWRLDI